MLGRTATFFSTLLAAVERERHDRWSEHVKEFNWKLFDHAVPFYTQERRASC